jgi:assimilatory nitrate reductase catalytic subunit
MSSAATAANFAFGMDRGLTFELNEIPQAECIILAGTNIAECQPTLMPYFLKAKKNGSFIIVIDPRETPTTKLADLHIKIKPGTDRVLVNGILKVLMEEGYTDKDFIGERTKGFQELNTFLQSINLAEITLMTDVSENEISSLQKNLEKRRQGSY